jgi:hypothetical protein
MSDMKDEKQKADPDLAEDKTTVEDETARPQEIISLDVGEEGEATPGLDEETTLQLLRQAQEEAYADRVAEHTNDAEVQEALVERQDLDTGRQVLRERLAQYHATSPELSGGDIDAAWDQANVGDETAGGTAATPDQDRVDEFGEAYGISYEDDEPLQTGDKLTERDRQRWELDPESAEEDEQL